MNEANKKILENRIARNVTITAFGLILALFLQKAIDEKGVAGLWNLSLIAMVLYCPLLYWLSWKFSSRILADLFTVDYRYASKLDLLSYTPTLLLLQYFLLQQMTQGIFEQRLLEIVFALICILKVGEFFFLLFREKRLHLTHAVRLSTFLLLVAVPIATVVFIRSYDYLLYKSIESRLIVKRTSEVAIGSEVRQVLYSPNAYLPKKNRIEKEISLANADTLSFGIGVARNSWFQSDTGVEFRVLVVSDGKTEEIYSRFLKPQVNVEDRGWIDETVDLSRFSGRDVTLIFETSVPYSEVASLKKILKSSFGYTKWLNIGKYGDVVEAVWSMPRVFSKNHEEETGVILISFDTLGAGHLGCYGYPRETTPHLDRFAAEGVVFKQCVAQSAWTLPSHMSLLTGQNCSTHGVVNNDCRLSESFVTLAEAFRSQGYQTAAITEGGNVSSTFGFAQGFDSYDNGAEHDVDRTFSKACRWLETQRHGRFFLFLHTYETHAFYKKREPYYSRFSSNYTGLVRGDLPFLGRPKSAPIFLRPEDRAELDALYDSEVAYIDERFEMLMDKLAALGLSASTTVVVTSDHGEGFGEHDYFGHGNTLYDELVMVPLLMKGPELPGGLSVDQQVRSIDIMPTLLQLCRLPLPENLDGRSLLPLIERSTEKTGPAISEVDAPAYGPTKKSIRDGDNKLILVTGGREELYDLAQDPKESLNLAAIERDTADRLHGRLVAKIDADLRKKVEIAGADTGSRSAVMDKSTRDQLKALGYLDH